MRNYYFSFTVGAIIVNSVIASPVTFTNHESTFIWVINGDGSIPNAIFDPTISAAAQTAGAPQSQRAFNHSAAVGGGSFSVSPDLMTGRSLIRLAQSPDPVIVNGPVEGEMRSFTVPQVFATGADVGDSAIYGFPGLATGAFGPALGRLNFLGQRAFVGFRVMLDDNLPHYGYIELDYRSTPLAGGLGSVMAYQPLSWAYESVANTPISIPVPPAGPVALFGVAAAVGARRRTR